MGASTSIEVISSGTVIPITLPVTRNIRLLSPGRLDRVGHSKAAGSKRARYSKRTSVPSSPPLFLAYLGSANGANIDSMSLARDRQINNARRATISMKSGLPLSDAALGGIIAGSLVVLWLLFVLVFLRRRSRNRQLERASIGDVENRGLLPASYDSSRHRSVSVTQSIDSPRLNPSPSPLLSQQRSQPLSEATTPISLPRSSNHQVPDRNIRKARLERPPPLVLRRERSDREARQGESLAMARPRSIKFTGVSNRDSVLPNPWDSGAKPSPAAFELVFFGLPSFSAPAPAPVRSKGSFKAGLPRTPRETRTFQPHEVRSLEVTHFAADRTRFEPRRGPGQT